LHQTGHEVLDGGAQLPPERLDVIFRRLAKKGIAGAGL
jgi:hypothetical protein